MPLLARARGHRVALARRRRSPLGDRRAGRRDRDLRVLPEALQVRSHRRRAVVRRRRASSRLAEHQLKTPLQRTRLLSWCALLACTLLVDSRAADPDATLKYKRNELLQGEWAWYIRVEYLELLRRAESNYRDVMASNTPPESNKKELVSALIWLARERSNVVDYSGAIEAYNSLRLLHPGITDASMMPVGEVPTEYAKSVLAEFEPEPAVAAIARAATGRRIVILNEVDFIPRHRVFATQVALELRKQGFE